MIHSDETHDEVGFRQQHLPTTSHKYYHSFRDDTYPHEKISLIDGPRLSLEEHDYGSEDLPYFNNPFVLYYSPNTSGFPMEHGVPELSHGPSSPEQEEPRALKSVRTDKRRISRVSGLLLAFLGFFLVVSSLLQSSPDPSSTHHRQSRDSEDFILSPQALRSSQQEESSEARMKRLPQCVIIGARKCGTRALIDMLNLHPQVEKAAVEVHFFDRDDNYGKGLDWYREHMPETSEDQLSIEKSPSYFVTPEVPERIHGMNSSIKLLLIVREPVTRVISDYTQIYGTNSKPHNGSKSPRLEDLVLSPDGSVNVHYKAVRISLYARYLQRWFDVFPPSQIHVIDGDALIRDPFPVLKDVERFLGLAPRLHRDNFYFNATKGFYCWRRLDSPPTTLSPSTAPQTANDTTSSPSLTGLHCLNDSKGRPHPVVDRHIVSKLRKFYNPHNLRFYDMVSRDFGWPEK